jgi:hypothetical protein
VEERDDEEEKEREEESMDSMGKGGMERESFWLGKGKMGEL